MGSLQAIEVIIALSRNSSQICDRCYTGYRTKAGSFSESSTGRKGHIMKNRVQLIAYVDHLAGGGFAELNYLLNGPLAMGAVSDAFGHARY